MNWTFLSCKCLIYVWFMIVDLFTCIVWILIERWIDSVFPRTFISQSNWNFPLDFWLELFINELNFSFLQMSDLCLIYDCGLISLHCLNFDRTMNWFRIPANIYFAIELTFSVWFLTCPFYKWNELFFLHNFVWFMFDLWLWTCGNANVWILIERWIDSVFPRTFISQSSRPLFTFRAVTQT